MTVFKLLLGDMMQFLTNSYLPSTPHKVGLNTRERYAFAYFHEPSFQATLSPLKKFYPEQTPEKIHYGTHFTNMFLRNYSDRVTSKRMERENRQQLLEQDSLRTLGLPRYDGAML
jgi:isopenicillin N synthase-like dioxygenase